MSTRTPTGLDCDGDGTAGQGAARVQGQDNANGDHYVGNTLDCEISGVTALNSTLANSSGDSKVSLEKFNSTAEAVDLDGSDTNGSTQLFAAPGEGAGAKPLVVAAADKLKTINTRGTTFDSPVTTALQTLKSAPAGPKYVMFLTDGKGKAAPATLNALKASGVKLRSFAIGNDGGCRTAGDLAKLAEVTGDSCFSVSDPASLSATLADNAPPAISSVQVSVGAKTFAANVDLTGGWSTTVRLANGTYTARATATLSDGTTYSATQRLTVTGSTGTSGATVRPTGIVSLQPKATLGALPVAVRGVVGKVVGRTLRKAPGLENAVVLLQGRTGAGATWHQVGRTRVGATGAYRVVRHNRAGVRQLRVVLLPYKHFGASRVRVLHPTISSCRITRHGARFTAVCATTARNGTKARLMHNGHLVKRAVVHAGHVKVSGTGKATRHVLVVDVNRRVHFRLAL